MIETFFDDRRHRQSEQLAFEAERSERAGDCDAAARKYAEAARLEEENALDVPAAAPRVRGLLAVSAVSLWLRAERWDEAARAGCAFLARPDMLTPGGCIELQSLIDRAWRMREVERTLGSEGTYVPLEAKLSGGQIRTGLAPSRVIAGRRDVITPLLVRVAEWRSKQQYRRAGQSSLASSYEFLEAPALAASYALRLYIGTGKQATLSGVVASPQDVVEQFLHLAAVAAERPEAVREEVRDEAYAQAFLRGFRDLAPDGDTVGRVDLGVITRGRLTGAAVLTSEARTRLTTALRKPGKEKTLDEEGVLKYVNLRGGEPRIGLETTNGPRSFRIAKGEHDDTIGPKLNRHVRIQGMRRVNDVGETAKWTADVILLDDSVSEPSP